MSRVILDTQFYRSRLTMTFSRQQLQLVLDGIDFAVGYERCPDYAALSDIAVAIEDALRDYDAERQRAEAADEAWHERTRGPEVDCFAVPPAIWAEDGARQR